MRWWYRTLQWWGRFISILFFQIRCYGERNVPARGGVVLASNHQSYLDPFLVGSVLRREVHHLARTSLFRNPAFRALIVALNAFPIERDSGDVKGVKHALSRLKAGHALLVFPEGTRTRDGRVAFMKEGIRLLADRAAVPIVPVLIEGAYNLWPRTRKFPGFGPVNVLFGPPVDPSDEGTFGARLRAAVRGLHETAHRKTQRSV